MSLLDHAIAFDALAAALRDEGDRANTALYHRLAKAHERAATSLRERVAADARATAQGHACTLSHAATGRCPACGEQRR